MRRQPLGGGSMAYITYGMRQGPASLLRPAEQILRRVLVTVVLASATCASPFTLCKAEVLLDLPTVVAGLAAGEETVHLDDLLPVSTSNVLEYGHELV